VRDIKHEVVPCLYFEQLARYLRKNAAARNYQNALITGASTR
jgi:hypothetical protein